MRKNHILVVDDNKAAREITRIMFNFSEYDVTLADNGEAGLEIFKNNLDTFDLVFTDFEMPMMNGLEMADRIKQLDDRMPIIMATANTQIKESETQKYGINSLYFKPYDYVELTQQVKQLIFSADKSRPPQSTALVDYLYNQQQPTSVNT